MDSALVVGQVVAGKYRIESIIGEGGMGTVVAASHLFLPQRVAIKVLRGEGSPELWARFLREARAAVRLRGEHVVRVLDLGQLETGTPYLVMEHLEGKDLGVVLRERGQLSVEDAVHYVLQACIGMAEAHALGIVHRDLKPANLFLTATPDGAPHVKVLDFGISKELDVGGAAEPLTRTRQMLGSPLYMSPEQMRSSRSADARSDIWSLGAILFRLLIGHPPFNAASIPEIIVKVTDSEPPRPSELRPEIPPALDQVILRCLKKDARGRFATVGELARALAPFAPPSAQELPERVARIIALSLPPPAVSDDAASVRPSGVGDLEATVPHRNASDVPVIVRGKSSRVAQGPLLFSAGVLLLGLAVAGGVALWRPGPSAPASGAHAGSTTLAAAPGRIDAQSPSAPTQGDSAPDAAPEAPLPAAGIPTVSSRSGPMPSATAVKTSRPVSSAPSPSAPSVRYADPFAIELK